MRIQLKLKVAKNFSYDLKYHSKLQGFIYKQLTDTPYRFLHEKKGYKFFCFSNIFPLKIGKNKRIKFKEGETKFLLISSPDKGFLYTLFRELEKLKEQNKLINLGEMSFYFEAIKFVEKKIKMKKITIKTETPIILRISKKTYEKYKVRPPKEYKYLFWRPKWPFELFIEPLTNNLLNKYRDFYQLKESEFNKLKNKVLPLFQRLEFKDTVVSHVIINGKEQRFIGSLWKFHFDYLNKEQKKLLEFALDTGFGEKNSYGFGFVNIV